MVHVFLIFVLTSPHTCPVPYRIISVAPSFVFSHSTPLFNILTFPFLLYSTPLHTHLHLNSFYTYITQTHFPPFLSPSLLTSVLPPLPHPASLLSHRWPLRDQTNYSPPVSAPQFTSVALSFPSPPGARWFFSYIDSVQASWRGGHIGSDRDLASVLLLLLCS